MLTTLERAEIRGNLSKKYGSLLIGLLSFAGHKLASLTGPEPPLMTGAGDVGQAMANIQLRVIRGKALVWNNGRIIRTVLGAGVGRFNS